MPELIDTHLRFGRYVKQMVKTVLTSSLVIGLVIGVCLLLIGEATMNLDMDLEISAFDGLWLMLGLPVIVLVICVLLSPLSYLIHRSLFRPGSGNVPPQG